MKKPKNPEVKPEEKLTNADIRPDGTIPHESVDLRESPEGGVQEVPVKHEDGPKEGDTGPEGTYHDGSWHKDPVVEIKESLETEERTKGSVPLPPEGDNGIGVAALQQQPVVDDGQGHLSRSQDAANALNGEEVDPETVKPATYLTYAEASAAGKDAAVHFLRSVASDAWGKVLEEKQGLHSRTEFDGLSPLEQLGLMTQVQFVIADPYAQPLGAFLKEEDDRDDVRALDGAIRERLGYAPFTYRDEAMS